MRLSSGQIIKAITNTQSPDTIPTGLTAADRSYEDISAIQENNNMVDTDEEEINKIKPPKQYDLYNGVQPSDRTFNINYSKPIEKPVNLQEERDRKKLFDDTFDYFKKSFDVGDSVNNEATKTIKELASNPEICPSYYVYNPQGKIDFTTDEWNEIAAEFATRLNLYGDEAAVDYLNYAVKKRVALNTTGLERAGKALRGLGTSAAGSLLGLAGVLYGAAQNVTYAAMNSNPLTRPFAEWGSGKKINPNMNAFENEINNLFDNSVTRLGNEIMERGHIFNNDLAKRYDEAGISMADLVKDPDVSENKIFTRYTLPELVSQSGFTLGAIGGAKGLNLVNKLVFKGARGISAAGINEASASLQELTQLNKSLSTVKNIENFNNRWIIPGIVGSGEGAIEGLQTKIDTEKSGIEALRKKYNDLIHSEFNKRKSQYSVVTEADGNNYIVTPEGDRIDEDVFDLELLGQIRKDFESQFEEDLEQIGYLSSKAGIKNFILNSAINGSINTVFKNALLGPEVSDAIRTSKLAQTKAFKWMSPRAEYNVTGKLGESVSVTPKISKISTAYQFLKEPVGEGLEEYFQELSNAYATGFFNYNIDEFIRRKYDTDATVTVGEIMDGWFLPALKETYNTAISKEALKSFTYGALGQALGSFAPPSRGRNASGEAVWGRGVRQDGTQEKWYDVVRRLSPWRTGIFANIDQIREERVAAKDMANTLQEWLNKKENIDKFTSIAGSISWSAEMQKAAEKGDEFSYRNSAMGKLINDVMLLNKLQGTDMYNSIMSIITDRATMEFDSEEAKKAIAEARNDDAISTEGKTDKEIFDTIKKNSNNMFEYIENIRKEERNVESFVGDVEDDVKQSIIFGKLMAKDAEKRLSQLNNEITQAYSGKSSVKDSGLNDKQKEALVKYGSVKKILEQKEVYKKKLEELKKDLSVLKSSKKDKSQEYRNKKLSVKLIEKALSEINDLGFTEQHNDVVLSEREIMSLDPALRSKMIEKAKRGLLNEISGKQEAEETKNNPVSSAINSPSHGYSEKQTEVIDNLIAEGTKNDDNFLKKVVDYGKLINNQKSLLKQNNLVLKNSRDFGRYLHNLKINAAIELAKEEAKNLENIDNFEEFSSYLDSYQDDHKQYESDALFDELEAKGSDKVKDFMKRYSNIRRNAFHALNILQYDKDMIDNPVFEQQVNLAVEYLVENNVDINDKDAVYEALLRKDGGYYAFSSHVERAMGGIQEDSQIIPDEATILRILSKLEKVNETIKEQEREKKVVEAPPVINKNADGTIPETQIPVDRNASQPEEIKVNNNTPEQNQPSNVPSGAPINTNASRMSTLNMEEIERTNPESALGKFIIKHDILRFLKDDFEKLEGKEIYFITSDELTNDVKKELGDKYSVDNLPIIIAIEDDGGSMTIDGKSYQPIGIMPNTNDSEYSGSSNLSEIRNIAKANTGNELVELNGKKLYAKPYGKYGIKAHVVDSGNRQSYDLFEVIRNSMTSTERKEAEGADNITLRNTKGYKRLKEKLLKRIKSILLPKGGAQLVYSHPNLKDGDTTPYINVKQLQETRQRNGNKSFEEVLEGKDTHEIITFNSRTEGIRRVFGTFFNKVLENELFGKQFESELNSEVDNLYNKIKNYLYLSPNYYGGTELKFRQEGTGDVFSLVLSTENPDIKPFNGENSIVLCSFEKDKLSDPGFIDTLVADVIINMTSDNGVVRTYDGNYGKESAAKWQVQYTDFEKQEQKMASENVSEMIDDGIFDIMESHLDHFVEGVEIQIPKQDFETQQNIDSNPNASTSNPMNVLTPDSTLGQTNEDAIVDADTGITLQEGNRSNPVQKSELPEETQKVVTRMEQDSENIVLSDDEKYYKRKSENKLFARVTTIAYADEGASEKPFSSEEKGKYNEDGTPNMNWKSYKKPSNLLGTMVDEFVRHFFGNKLKPLNSYKGTTADKLDLFKKQLERLDNFFSQKGYYVMANGIKCSGQIEVTMSNGDKKMLDVAGTLDILCVDKNGHLHIFDMKTQRGDNWTVNIDSWRRQLTLYKKLLEQQYGIVIDTINIIPISLQSKYSPETHDKTWEEREDGIYYNGEIYDDAAPFLEEEVFMNQNDDGTQLQNMKEYNFNILGEKLPEDVKQMLDAVTEEVKASEPNDSLNIQPEEDTKAEKIDVPVQEPVPFENGFDEFGLPVIPGMSSEIPSGRFIDQRMLPEFLSEEDKGKILAMYKEYRDMSDEEKLKMYEEDLRTEPQEFIEHIKECLDL